MVEKATACLRRSNRVAASFGLDISTGGERRLGRSLKTAPSKDTLDFLRVNRMLAHCLARAPGQVHLLCGRAAGRGRAAPRTRRRPPDRAPAGRAHGGRASSGRDRRDQHALRGGHDHPRGEPAASGVLLAGVVRSHGRPRLLKIRSWPRHASGKLGKWVVRNPSRSTGIWPALPLHPQGRPPRRPQDRS